MSAVLRNHPDSVPRGSNLRVLLSLAAVLQMGILSSAHGFASRYVMCADVALSKRVITLRPPATTCRRLRKRAWGVSRHYLGCKKGFDGDKCGFTLLD